MKTFILRDPEHAKALIAFLKANAGPQAASGKPLEVTVAPHRQKRSNEQNARYWALLSEIAEGAQVNGKWFDRDVWHEHMKDKFAPKVEGPSGLLSVSTTQMSVEQFAQYMTQIEVYAAQELGVQFDAIGV